MKLEPEHESILAGEAGATLGLAMKTLVEYDGDDLFEQLSNGDRIEVDGNTGEIRIQ